MNAPDLDRLFGDLRASTPRPPQDLTSSVMSRLGPSVMQVRKTLWAGAAACLLSMLVAATIALATASGTAEAAPPEFTLLTRGAGPFASL